MDGEGEHELQRKLGLEKLGKYKSYLKPSPLPCDQQYSGLKLRKGEESGKKVWLDLIHQD